MSTILQVTRRNGSKAAPLLRAQCDCGRVYLTTGWPGEVRLRKRCIVCRPGPSLAVCMAGVRARAKSIRKAKQ